MTKREKALVAIYQNAQERLLKEIVGKAAVGNSKAYQKAMLDEVNKILAELQEQSVKWVEDNIPTVYKNGLSQARGNTKAVYGLSADDYSTLKKLTQKQITVVNKKAIALLVSDFSIDLSIANKSLQDNIQNVIAEKIAAGETIQQTSLRIREAIYGSNGQGKISILCKDGITRNYDPVAYAEMVARSATAETTNTAASNEADSVGSKVVAMTEHSPTCKLCIVYQGRWYSIDPSYKEYPYLYETAYKNGRNTIHPRCRHRIYAIILELEDAEHIEMMKKLSNKEFKPSKKDEKIIKRFYKVQNDIRKKTNDYNQYQRYINRIGKEYCPKSFSGFRRMKKSDNANWGILQAQYKGMGYYNRAVKNEPSVTSVVKSIASKNNMDMAGLDFRIKGKGSYLRKIKSEYEEKGNKFEIKDILRYTCVDDGDVLVSKSLKSIEDYKDMGYNIVKISNSWIDPTNPYNGINTVLRNVDGQAFELQFHTAESLLKKEEIHPFYEEWRVLIDGDPRRDALIDKMHDITKDMIPPKNIKDMR